MTASLDSTADFPLFDFTKVETLLLLDEGPGKISGIVDDLIHATRLNMRELLVATKTRDLTGIILSSHKLVSGSGYLGLMRMRALALMMENAAKAGNLDDGIEFVEPLRLAYAAGIAALEDAISNRKFTAV
jgi:hypothetical protein